MSVRPAQSRYHHSSRDWLILLYDRIIMRSVGVTLEGNEKAAALHELYWVRTEIDRLLAQLKQEEDEDASPPSA